jgi:hypothetical protein
MSGHHEDVIVLDLFILPSNWNRVLFGWLPSNPEGGRTSSQKSEIGPLDQPFGGRDRQDPQHLARALRAFAPRPRDRCRQVQGTLGLYSLPSAERSCCPQRSSGRLSLPPLRRWGRDERVSSRKEHLPALARNAECEADRLFGEGEYVEAERFKKTRRRLSRYGEGGRVPTSPTPSCTG